MSHQGKRLRSGEKAIVMKVRSFFETEKVQDKSIMLIDRTAKATGVGKTTIKKISKELQAEGEFKTPQKRYESSRVRINLGDFDTDIIRRETHAAYDLDSLHKKLHDKQVVHGGRSTLRKILRKMGFRYKKRADGKLYVYEQPRVTQQRHDYLRRMRRNRTEKRPIVYLDETWLNAHAAPERIWVDSDDIGGFRHPSGKGRRLIILHAGCCDGWIPGCELVFVSKKKTEDYHDEMNAQHFLEWFFFPRFRRSLCDGQRQISQYCRREGTNDDLQEEGDAGMVKKTSY